MVSRRLRFEILKRDGHTCRYCGASAPDVALTVDHVIPVALGGGDDPSNLVTACADCNSGKAASTPSDQLVADVDAAALLWAKAIAKATQMRRDEMVEIDASLCEFDAIWTGYGDIFDQPSNWADSIERFLEHGLTLRDMERMVAIAMAANVSHRQVWKYFCGVAWKEVGRRQELARRLLEDEEV